MIELEEALARITQPILPLAAESVELLDATDRYAAEDILAPISLPPFDNSAMDGYAVRAADVNGASAAGPCRLKLLGAIPAGIESNAAVVAQTCLRVFTGSPMPAGADAVVMQEDTRSNGEFIDVLDAVKPWENVRFAGQDVNRNARVGRAGDRITATKLALFAALGIERVSVFKKPVVAVISTGTELVEAGAALGPGKIYESNRASIAALARSAGAVVRTFPLVPDNFAATVETLRSAFDGCDLVITTGGVSVGEHDLVKGAFESLGGALEFWRVAIKPGKPFAFGRFGKKLLFGLPGNPVSAFVTFLLLARPGLLGLQGANEIHLRSVPAELGEPIENRGERRHFMRVIIDGEGNVKSAGLQASHALSSLAEANGLLDVPAKTSWPAGRRVLVRCWNA